MEKSVMDFDEIAEIIKPLMAKYKIKEVYLFGSYARDDATEDSDIDLLVYGNEAFRPVSIFAFAEELRIKTKKNIDAFEIREVNQNSEFYYTIMNERRLIA